MSKKCKLRLSSYIGITIVAVLAIGIAYSSIKVPIAFAAAGNTSSLVLLDNTVNGKIDRIEWEIANPGAETWSLTGVSPHGISITYDGTPVTVTTVSITSAADANPLTMRAVINEGGVSYDTSDGHIELIYTQGNGGVNCIAQACITGTTLEMSAIATGDSGAGNIEADGAAPQIKTAAYQDVDLDGKIDTISLDFSETLNAASVLAHENLFLTAGDFTLAAFGLDGDDLVGAVSTVDITLGTEASVVDTYSTVLAITSQDGVADFSLTDGTNENTTPKAEAQISTFVDEAKPVIATSTPTDASSVQSRTNSVVYTFSEPMSIGTWVEGTGVDYNFDATPSGSGWSSSFTDATNSITLTHSPFLCVQSYSIAFTPANIAAAHGSALYAQLNNASTAPIGATHTFTTMSCSSSSSSSSSSTTTEEDTTTDEEETVTDEEDTTTDETTTDEETTEETSTTGEQAYSPVTGELEDISVVSAGDYIKSPYFSTVYYVAEDLSRKPFMDSQTYFTYADSFDEITTVTDATLATLDLGSVMLPNPGVVLLKVQSDPKTYAIDEGNNLRWITSEAVATTLYGSSWASYIIDIEPTFFSRFGQGEMITSASSITVSDTMKTRTELAE